MVKSLHGLLKVLDSSPSTMKRKKSKEDEEEEKGKEEKKESAGQISLRTVGR